MKNVIIGTAGHIDHGKTTLIGALTGHNTDRLKEEQKRGISIDLGFTYFDLPSGIRAGIIDVPGHEKFIKNMLAGVVGMDVVIMVVAADEGIMPQTIEHLEILDLLGIENGLIALTKVDTVDDEWIELVKEDTRDQVQGTFLKDKPIIEISSTEGTGLDELKEAIDEIVAGIEEEDPAGDLPRLPVDRSFVISGYGTVVTGTLTSGVFRVDDEVQVFPSDTITRIRFLQVHDKDVQEAYKGQRVAINLAGIKKEEAPRGSMIAPPASMEPSKLLDVRIRTIDLDFDLANRTRIRLYLGTQEVFGRIILLEDDELTSRQEAYAQLILEDELVARKGDRFILRLFSPMITIGGGQVIDANPRRKKRFNEEDIQLVRLMGTGDAKDTTEAMIGEKSQDFPSVSAIAKFQARPVDQVEKEVEALEEEARVYVIKMPGESYVIHKNFAQDLTESISKELEAYHDQYPLRLGINKEEVRSKYFSKADKRVGDLFLDVIVNNSDLEERNNHIKKESFIVEFSDKHEQIKSDIINNYDKEFLSSPDVIEELSGKYKKDELNEVYRALISSGDLVIIDADTVLKGSDYSKASKTIINYIKENDIIGLAEARDLLGTNRKTALALLEQMDREGITKRHEDGRVLV